MKTARWMRCWQKLDIIWIYRKKCFRNTNSFVIEKNQIIHDKKWKSEFGTFWRSVITKYFIGVCWFLTKNYGNYDLPLKKFHNWTLKTPVLSWRNWIKSSWYFNLLHIFANPSSSTHKKRCQLLQHFFVWKHTEY